MTAPARPTVLPRDLHLAENLSPEQKVVVDALIRLMRVTDTRNQSFEYVETQETVEVIEDNVVRVVQAFAKLLNAETAEPVNTEGA